MATPFEVTHPHGLDRRGQDLVGLKALSRDFPTVDSATAEMARIAAELTLPMPTIHVISDIHGEYRKLRHVINNASGTLRPLVERLLRKKVSAAEFDELITLVFYPAEVVGRLHDSLQTAEQQREYALRTLGYLFEVVRELAARHSLKDVHRIFPVEFHDLFAEILHSPSAERDRSYVEAIVNELVRRGRMLHVIHLTGRVIRNLAVGELVIAGDCWDRGPRGDKVVDYLMQQPKVSFIWGNHDMAWLGACLGHEALICHVLRISMRYRRLSQLEEGYGIPLQPLEVLVRKVYAEDPAECFQPKAGGMREKATIARMHKAVAIMQFKLEGQMIRRHPEWEMEERCLLHRIDAEGGILIDGVRHPLRDRHLPTVDPLSPYALSEEEKQCLARIRESFLASKPLWNQMRWMVANGAMYLRREENLIFHGCLPVDEAGEFLPMTVKGRSVRGREMMDAIEMLVYGVLETREQDALDTLWYLWSGPRSPLFGKDRITTFERDFLDARETHHETKNPYFALIHEAWFCEKILAEFGMDRDVGLVVNGHVPVQLEKGESPLKRCGKAITIDGAFSEAYGDHGFTLLIEPHGTSLAMHHHFESVEAAISTGSDIIPTVTPVRMWDVPKRIADSQRGAELRQIAGTLERLVAAYRANAFPQRTGAED
jgi:fructose-1,6-bisphosphatase-3